MIISYTGPQFYKLNVRAIENVTHNTRLFILAKPLDKDLQVPPGRHVKIRALVEGAYTDIHVNVNDWCCVLLLCLSSFSVVVSVMNINFTHVHSYVTSIFWWPLPSPSYKLELEWSTCISLHYTCTWRCF